MRVVFPQVYKLFLLLALIPSASQALAGGLLVGVPVSMTEVIQAAADKFSEENSSSVRLSAAASSTLAQQALAGAPFDVVITADDLTMDKIAAAGLIAAGSRRRIIGNRLALIVPRAVVNNHAATITSLRDLLSPRIRRIAIAEKTVPAGHYGRALLAKHEILEPLRTKLVSATHVRAVLALVSSGAVDAGFVYVTDVPIARSKVAIAYTSDDSDSEPIHYEAAALSRSPNLSTASAFINHLTSPSNLKLFELRGFRRL